MGIRTLAHRCFAHPPMRMSGWFDWLKALSKAQVASGQARYRACTRLNWGIR